MPQNVIQFQPGLSLDEFFARYGTEAQCAAALEASQWPQGFVCPHCEATTHSRFQADGRAYWQCAQCRVQTSLTCGTLFESSKLPLTKWFQAMYTEQIPNFGFQFRIISKFSVSKERNESACLSSWSKNPWQALLYSAKVS